MAYLSPRSDTAFKKLFGHENHTSLTISFLNAILQLPDEKLIDKIYLQETKQWPNSINGREVAFDVYCKDDKNDPNNHFIIEMQSLNEYNFSERAQYYVARALSNQLKPTENYLGLVPVIFIGVINYNLEKIHKEKLERKFRLASLIALEEFIQKSHDPLSHYSLINRATGQILPVPLMEFHFVELPKFNKSIEECTTDIDKWLYFMKEADSCEQVPAQMKKSKNFTQAFEILNKKNWTNEEFEDYVNELDSLGREDRVAEGNFYYGKDEGMQEKAQAIALESLKEGLSLLTISKITGLAIEDLEALQKKLS